jgi:hypothetical protein
MEENKKKKSVRELITIINSLDEFRPSPTDKRWKKKDGLEIMQGTIQYNINDHLIKKMELYTSIYKKIPDVENCDIIKKFNDQIAIIYEAEDEKRGTKYIGFTGNPLLTFIKFNLHKRNMGLRDIFENFQIDDPKDISFRVLEYVKYNDNMDIIVRRRYWKTKLIDDVAAKRRKEREERDEKNDDDTESSVDPEELVEQFYEERMELFYEVFDDFETDFRPFVGHIYSFKQKEEDKEFIGGFERKMTKDKFIDLLYKFGDYEKIADDLTKYTKQGFQFREIEKYKARSPFDFMLRLDFWKLKRDTINKGYNSKLSMDESEKLFSRDFPSRHQKVLERNFYVKIQQHLFIKNYTDDHDYDNIFGFIYEIKHKEDDKRFFGTAFQKTLKDIVIELYDKSLEGNIKHNKILKILMEDRYGDFEFNVIKIKTMDDTSLDLVLETEKLITEYKTREDDYGYNIDHRDLKRKIMMGKRNKK